MESVQEREGKRRRRRRRRLRGGGLGLHRDQDAMHTRCIEGPDHEECSVHGDGPPMQCRYESCIHGSPSFSPLPLLPPRTHSSEPRATLSPPRPARDTLRHVCCVLRHIILMNTECLSRESCLREISVSLPPSRAQKKIGHRCHLPLSEIGIT